MLSLIGRGMSRTMMIRRAIGTTPKLLAEFTDPIDHATGIEKRELLLKRAGITDPWMQEFPMKRGAGTKDSPTLIPSAFDGRLVGCLCDDHQRYVCWMWLEEGCPKRCECGHWFKIQKVDPI